VGSVAVDTEGLVSGRALALAINVDLNAVPSSPAPPSLVAGHLSLVTSVATVIALSALTVLCLYWSNGMDGGLFSELQSPSLALGHA